MDFSWAIKYATEFLGTAILIILGNGAVANVELKGTDNGFMDYEISYFDEDENEIFKICL